MDYKWSTKTLYTAVHYYNYKEEKREFRHQMRLAANEFEINENELIDI